MQGHVVDVLALHTPRPGLAIIVTKSFSVSIVCRDMWPIFMKMGSSCMKIKPKLNINLVMVGLDKQKLKTPNNLGRAAYPTQIHQATKKLNPPTRFKLGRFRMVRKPQECQWHTLERL